MVAPDEPVAGGALAASLPVLPGRLAQQALRKPKAELGHPGAFGRLKQQGMRQARPLLEQPS